MAPPVEFPEPTGPPLAIAEVFLGYLDYFRARVVTGIGSLAEEDRRRSQLPSGWTPLELAKHLTFMEMRWLEWGFEGRPVEDPWGDHQDGRWHVRADETSAQVMEALLRQGTRTSSVVRRHGMDEIGAPGPRWGGEQPPRLERILLHVLQEYARHLGHLDVVVELTTGQVGD